MKNQNVVRKNFSQMLFGILVIASLLITACTKTATLEPTQTAEPTQTEAPATVAADYSSLPFVGKTWFWTETVFNNETKTTVADPSRYSILLNPDGTLAGKADCNAFNGTYSVTDSNIAIVLGPMTMAACPPDSQADEYIRTLGQVVIYFMQDSALFFDLQMDTGTMRFSEQPVPVAANVDYSGLPLIGKVWQWARLDMNDDSVTQVPLPSSYSLEFLPDGNFQGQADCNMVGGTYIADNQSITIQPAQMTLVACPPDSLSDTFVTRLGEVATYVIENSILYLNLKMDSGNMVFGPAPIASVTDPVEGQPSARAAGYPGVYVGPGYNFPILGVMVPEGLAQVVGKSQDAAWWAISLPGVPTGQGWVSAEKVNTNNAESVTVAPAPIAPPSITLATPGASDESQVRFLETVYARSGPGDQYPALGVITAPTNGALIGQSQDGAWWVVRVDPALVPSGNVWVSVNFTVPTNPRQAAVVEAPILPDGIILPTPPAGTASGVVLTSVNVRSGPGTNFPVLGATSAGSVGEITGKSADSLWWQMRLPAGTSTDGFGWIYASFILASNTANVPTVGASTPAPAASPVAVYTPVGTTTSGGGSVKIGTTIEPLNIYSGPGKQYNVVAALPAGYSGVIVETSSDGKWVAFAMSTSVVSSGKGWVNAAYVSIKTVSAATATAMATSKPPIVATPVPTGSPQPTPSSTSCKVIELQPANGTVFKPNADFDMKVVCKNTGQTDLTPASVDIQFIVAVDGVVIHQGGNVFDLPELVAPGKEFTFFVDMLAPENEGEYGETWALVEGSKILCQWSFTISVVKP